MKKINRESSTDAAAEPCGAIPHYDRADTTDATLIEAERRYIAYRAWWKADKSNYSDTESRRRGVITEALQTFIAGAPVHTLAGVAVKLRGLYNDLQLDEGDDDHSVWTRDLVESALDACARLAKREPAA